MRDINNIAEFKQLIEQDKPVLLDFYADWCAPCRVLHPVIDKLEAKHGDHFLFAKINVDKQSELAQQFGVRSIPSLFFIQDGKVQENIVGVQSEAALDKKVQGYIAANSPA
jgi:thioredoxin 1